MASVVSSLLMGMTLANFAVNICIIYLVVLLHIYGSYNLQVKMIHRSLLTKRVLSEIVIVGYRYESLIELVVADDTSAVIIVARHDDNPK